MITSRSRRVMCIASAFLAEFAVLVWLSSTTPAVDHDEEQPPKVRLRAETKEEAGEVFVVDARDVISKTAPMPPLEARAISATSSPIAVAAVVPVSRPTEDLLEQVLSASAAPTADASEGVVYVFHLDKSRWPDDVRHYGAQIGLTTSTGRPASFEFVCDLDSFRIVGRDLANAYFAFELDATITADVVAKVEATGWRNEDTRRPRAFVLLSAGFRQEIEETIVIAGRERHLDPSAIKRAHLEFSAGSIKVMEVERE